MASSIKEGLKKLDKKNKGFLIVQSDMPFIKKTHLNKIYNSLLHNRYSVHLLRFKNKTLFCLQLEVFFILILFIEFMLYLIICLIS